MTAWVRDYESSEGLEFLEHLNGVAWFKAALPRRRHKCSAQTRGFMSGGWVERCRCGAIRVLNSGPWMERNSSRRPAMTATPKPQPKPVPKWVELKEYIAVGLVVLPLGLFAFVAWLVTR